jgi:hypothetical protein
MMQPPSLSLHSTISAGVHLYWDIAQIEGVLLETWLPMVFDRLEELSRLCGGRHGSVGVWIEDKNFGTILLQQAIRRQWPATAIDSKLTAVSQAESRQRQWIAGLARVSGRSDEAAVPVVNQIRIYWWCSPPRIGRQRICPASSTARETGASFSKDKCVRTSL